MHNGLTLKIGLKTDPIEYRYSYEWLFRILHDENVKHVQLGTFFEIYQLPDENFIKIRKTAKDFDIEISSIFTAHRELGGFFYSDPAYESIARKNYERLIKIGQLVGASSVGSNPGAILRDMPGLKDKGVQCYLRNMKELMHSAKNQGLKWLTIEPMSCLAEPPTLPEEMRHMCEDLMQYHRIHLSDTVPVGYCFDVSHGYADKERVIRYNHMQQLEAALPYTTELHLKNTDQIFNSTFGFGEEERKRGIVEIAAIRDYIVAHASKLPVDTLIGYVEISGPKTGRDYTDHLLEKQLRDSLQHARENFELVSATAAKTPVRSPAVKIPEKAVSESSVVQISPSLMCANQCYLAESIRRLEEVGVDMLHMDLMDAHFVPNMPMGMEVIRELRPITALPFDVHLMVENNDFFITKLAELGVNQVSIHAESSVHLDRSLALIRSHNMKAGVALNPATPLNILDYVLDRLDFVVLMTVNPGFAGQKLVPGAFLKIKSCKEYLTQRGISIPIEVDGNVSFENIPNMVAAGADILVAGTSSLYHKRSSLKDNMRDTKNAIAAGLAMRKS